MNHFKDLSNDDLVDVYKQVQQMLDRRNTLSENRSYLMEMADVDRELTARQINVYKCLHDCR